jgi:hypothetical protein
VIKVVARSLLFMLVVEAQAIGQDITVSLVKRLYGSKYGTDVKLILI